MDFNTLYFIKCNTLLNKTIPLQIQCKDGDLILISQVCMFKTKWKDMKKSMYYYTNVIWENMFYILLDEYVIPKNENQKYKLKIGNQYLFLKALIPFEGVTDEVEVVDKLGKN